MFSIVNAVLLAPLPYPGSDRLVLVYDTQPACTSCPALGQPRLMSALTALFGGLAGLRATVGVYGVMAYNVRRQRREFGIRLALGADASNVRKLVVLRGLVLAIVGVAIGAGGAYWLTGLLESMLNDVQPTDPMVFAATAARVVAVALAASWLPARAASRVDPMVALRDA